MTNLIFFLRRVLYVNRRDFESDRAGYDAVIAQMMNQMDGTTGPPPMAKEKIAQIPTVSIDQQQVG